MADLRANMAMLQWKRRPSRFRHYHAADAIRLQVMERLHDLSEGQN
jgi:hypothetical protein